MSRIRDGEHPDKRRGGRIGLPWPIGRKHSGTEAAFECLDERRRGGSSGIFGRGCTSISGELTPGDRWLEGEGYPDEFGLEDLLQFFGAEGMGLDG